MSDRELCLGVVVEDFDLLSGSWRVVALKLLGHHISKLHSKFIGFKSSRIKFSGTPYDATISIDIVASKHYSSSVKDNNIFFALDKAFKDLKECD